MAPKIAIVYVSPALPADEPPGLELEGASGEHSPASAPDVLSYRG